jgi:predicted DNA-binding transcriptional regulator YafY
MPGTIKPSLRRRCPETRVSKLSGIAYHPRMGQRSRTATVVAILQAFLQRRSWKQAELARHVDVTVAALRKHLTELTTSGFPLIREDDHPHVWWSVPRDWFPGAVLFDADSVPELLRQLGRMPRSAARDRLIRRVLEAAPHHDPAPAAKAVLAPRSTESEESYLPLAEDSAIHGVCLCFNYFTASRGSLEWRRASVQRVLIGPPARFVAVCHRSDRLKWFRLDNVLGARLDPAEPYRAADPAEVEAMLRESFDGFHQGGAAVSCAFVVREPESRWVERNLPGPMTVEVVPGGLRFSAVTAGVLRLARFVVGLGAAARVETPELSVLVAELARGALEACGCAA